MIIKCISIYLFIGVMLLSFIFVNSFLRGKSSYAKVLGVLSLAIQIYLLGYLMEINVGSLNQMLFWNQIQYLGIPFYPALWLTVSLLYTGREKYLKGYRGIAIFAIPLITYILHLTNNWHHLYYKNVELQQFKGIKLMLLTKGPWYLVQTVYILAALVLCTWFYFQRYRKSTGDEKIQFRILFIASVLPYLALILDMVNTGGLSFDYAALILPPCVLLISLALTRYNFLEIKVLARERVFEDSAEGLLLLNRFFKVVDFNTASIRFFSLFGAEIKEERLDILLKDQQELLDCIRRAEEKVFHRVVGGDERYISISIKEVQNKEHEAGLLITFEDVTERELLRRRLIEMASTDELSGLNNRRRFRECAEEAFHYAQQYQTPLSVLMMDIDYFKKVNDSFGHQIGDVVIRNFSEMLVSVFGESNIVGRMGGEEFAVILPDVFMQQAYEQAEFFRQAVEKKIMIFGQWQVKVTVSIGVTEYNEKIPTLDTLMNQADSAMYDAKHEGRNRTMVVNR